MLNLALVLKEKPLLRGFYRVRPDHPGFAIPVFEVENRLMVQHLDERGMMNGFILCDVDSSQLLPPEPAVSSEELPAPGTPPLNAFQCSDGRIVVGTKPTLESILQDELPRLESRPFLQLEIAKYLKDEKLINEATARTEGLLRNAPASRFMGISERIRKVVELAKRVASSDVSILVIGETGTGKQLIAEAIHNFGYRARQPFVKVNCSALPSDLVESELFGSVKGAFTGAHSDREGLFKLAEGGTLLLDEVADLPLDVQGKLIHVLQDHEITPVGGRVSYRVNARIIATTNRDLEQAVREGKFREDLYYRLNVIPIHVPSLRERGEDIIPLAEEFLQRSAAQLNRKIEGFSPEAIQFLKSYDYPGNTRELQNLINRGVILCKSNVLDVEDFLFSAEPATRRASPSHGLEDIEREAIIQMLKETSGNKLEAAKRLGISRRLLHEKLKSYGTSESAP